MSVNFEYYKVFYYTAKYRNFTKAASLLCTSQPSVSRMIRLLEQELGCSLFIRTPKGVMLTPEGQELYSHVAPACEGIFAGEENLIRTSGLKGGTIRIGASETALRCYVFEELEQFYTSYPDIRLQIQNYTAIEAVCALQTGKVDLAIVTTPAEIYQPLKLTKLVPFQEILVGGPRFHFLSGYPLHLEALSGYPFICLSKGTKTRIFYESFYSSHKIPFSPEIEVGTSDLVLPCVRHNLGLGFLPRDFAVTALEQKEVFEIHLMEEIPQRYICMIEDPLHPLGQSAQLLKKHLLQSATV